MSALKRIVGSFWFKLALSVGLLALLLVETDVRELAAAVARTDPLWMLAAFVGYVFSQVISALRWCLLARPLGFHEPFARFFRCYFAGMYLNLFAPSTVAGDIGRALFLARGRRRGRAFTSVVADRGLGFVVLVWLAAAVIVAAPGYPLPWPLYWSAWFVFPATLAAWRWGPRLALPLAPAGSRRRAFVERDLRPYRRNPRVIANSLAIALLFHSIQIVTQIFIASALALEIPWTFFFIFVPVVNLAGMLPITFSGVGIREAGYVYFLSMVGVDRESAIALGLLSSAIVLATGLTGAPMFVLLDRRPAADEPAGEDLDSMGVIDISADGASR